MGGFPLYKGKEAFEKAAYWARKVRNSRLHTLNPDYKEVFTNLSKDIYDLTYRESIWEIEFKGNNQDGHTTGGCVGSYNGVYNNQNDAYGFGYGYVSVTLKLFDLFDDPNDEGRGVLEFKQGFNGYVEQMVGKFTLPVDKFRFGVSNLAHKLLRR